MSHLFSAQASLRMSVVMKNVMVKCNYILCIQRMRDIRVSCLSGLPYQWCEYKNSKGTRWIVLKFEIHIGCDGTMSWLTLLGFRPKVKTTASVKVMIFIHFIQSSFHDHFLEVKSMTFGMKGLLGDCSRYFHFYQNSEISVNFMHVHQDCFWDACHKKGLTW